LSPNLANVTFKPNAPVFVIRATPTELRALERRTGVTFAPVPFARALTAHDVGNGIGGGGSADAVIDLARAVEPASGGR